jgi:hypothetical protein
MGIVEKPSIRSYWSTASLIETPIFHKTMSRDSYLNLLTFFHITDNEQAVLRGHDDYNPLFKVHSFKEQHIAIDEGMVHWKGRLSFRQYLPNKPDRFGIYQLSESKSGYICDFEVYTSKDFDPNPDGDEEDKQLGHSYNVVLGLLRNNNLLGKGYTVYTDNYYSSPTLFDKLRSEDTTVVGTVRLTRKEMPIALKRKMKKDEIICRQRENLLALKWTDKRDVSILSTKHTAQCSVLLNKVDRNTVDPVSKPSAILDYNCNMGGVDLSDQLNKYYSMRRKTWKWWIWVVLLHHYIHAYKIICFFNT